MDKLLDDATQGKASVAIDDLLPIITLATNMGKSILLRDKLPASPSMAQFTQALTDLMVEKERSESLFEKEQLVAALAGIRLKLLKLSLVHDSALSNLDKEFL